MFNSFHLQGVEALNKGDLTQAKKFLLQAIEQNPEVHETYFFLGKTCFLADEKKEALFFLKKFIELTQDLKDEPNKSYAFDLLGQCYAADNEDEIAITCYLNVIEIDPSCASVRQNLGLLYMKQAQEYLELNLEKCLTLLRDAQIALKSSLELCSNNPMFLHSIASWYEQYIELLKKLSEENSLAEMINKQFNHAIHYYLEALAHCHENDQLLHSAITENLTECYAQFGHYLYQNQEYAKAQELYLAALELDQTHIPALNQMGMCLFKQGNYAEARAPFAKLIDLSEDKQDKADAWLNIACCYRLEKNWEKAKASLNVAKRLAPQDPEIVKEMENLKQSKSQSVLSLTDQAFFDPLVNNNSSLISPNTESLQFK
ncbi:tetratricopeptide repeat protein [Legionella sp. WA2024007413]